MKRLFIHACCVSTIILGSTWALAQSAEPADSVDTATDVPPPPAATATDAPPPAAASGPTPQPAPAMPPPAAPAPPPPASGPVMPQTVTPAPTQQPVTVTIVDTAPTLRPYQVSVLVEVPIFMDVPRDVVRPGGGAFGSFGYVLKETLVPFAGFGYTGNPIDLAESDHPDAPDVREPLQRIWLSVGVQLQQRFGAVMPYLSFAADFNGWHLLEEGIACGSYCFTYPQFRFTPGFSGRVGMQYAVDENGRFNVDLGLKIGFTGPGDFFEDQEYWLSPYIGLTFRP